MKNLRLPRSLRAEGGLAPSVMARTSLALGLSTAALLPVSALAQEKAAAPAQAASGLPAQKVRATAIDPNPNAQPGVPYKAKTSGDTRHTRPLAETPQTISVITKSAIDDSGLTDLKQILGAQPGITLGTGENGNAFGDRYIIRGQEARSDVFVDGLRDPGMSTRESFAIEQLEISKGPNSSFAGRGTAGGAINAITKQATLDYDFYRLSTSLGSDKHTRVTADLNKGFTDQFALRANVLYGDEGVPDRSPSTRNRQGLALSGLYEISKDLSITVDYYGLRAKDDQPDLGSYLVGNLPNRKPAKNVPVYAQPTDFQRTNVDTLTARIKYQIAPDTSLNSLTRYGSTRNAYITTGASYGTRYVGATGTPYSTAYIDNGHTGWQDVKYFAHQTNLRADRVLAGMKHEFIFSGEYTDHHVLSGSYNLNQSGFNCRNASGTPQSPFIGANNAYCWNSITGTSFGNPQTLAVRNIVREGKTRDWHVKTLSLAAMDTVDLTDQWTVFGGVRADHYKLSLNVLTGTAAGKYDDDDTLFNGHLGVSYKINPQAMVYASLATAEDINGGEADSGTSAGYGGYIIPTVKAGQAKPEKSTNFELGGKWNLLNDKLLATVAAFQTTKSDVMEGAEGTGATAYTPDGTFNSGKNRVRGIEFGLTGNVTEDFTVQAGVAFMKSKILESKVSQARVGKPLSNFANRTFSVQGKYQITSAFSLGATVRHESDRCGGQPDTAAGYTGDQCSQPVPSFTVYDLFGAYRFNKSLNLRVNLLNVGNKDYYTAVYRSGSFLYKGDARALRAALEYEF